MSFISKAVLALALILFLAMGGVLALKTTEAEAKTSILYCGSPGPKNCNAYPYKPHGGERIHLRQKAYSAASGSINILYVTGLAARAMVKSELKAA